MRRPWICQEGYDAFASVDEDMGEHLELAPEDCDALSAALSSPPAPNEALKKLLRGAITRRYSEALRYLAKGAE